LTVVIAGPPRVVPETWDRRQRESFVEIAQRCQNEQCASFTLVSLGLQLYLTNHALGKADHDRSVERARLSAAGQRASAALGF
tara:strand:+ start:1563 stop:1811 length:249 start_codon:yes stop_codon:yes gene_type:complete